ncbi:MAG: tRNA (N6-threonylcarbamoyladenosine(37)-N6)-methyltransferase TrmO [Spirochaetota bacterium]|nr:tRNA (N6-threonylcarbamoyladenosine(37)-N6)-methyltransferase TrmO [Spirochaetota bacterium]
MDEIVYKPIGLIHSPFIEVKGTPIQSAVAKGIEGRVEIFSEYAEGLKDIEGFSHVFLIYHFHLSIKYSLRAEPFLDKEEHGIFAIRSPSRPNPIGISIVRIVRLEGKILYIQDVDILNETPHLDIKPYVPEFDKREGTKIGWLEKNIHKIHSARDDGRFAV